MVTVAVQIGPALITVLVSKVVMRLCIMLTFPSILVRALICVLANKVVSANDFELREEIQDFSTLEILALLSFTAKPVLPTPPTRLDFRLGSTDKSGQ